jgi:general stress protein 26
MEIPEPQRPSLSGYVQHGKLLPWKWVDARMREARSYWITTRTSGYPSSRPVWGIWQSPILLFSTGSLIASNIRRDPRVQINLESADELIIVEGIAQALMDQEMAQVWSDTYNEKYNWDMPARVDDVYRVSPERVLAWICDSTGLDHGSGFSNSATEWKFPSRQ